MIDPLAELGLAPGATADDIRSARRRLAKEHHPDAGGDDERMRLINRAAADALRTLSNQQRTPGTPDDSSAPAPAPTTPGATATSGEPTWAGVASDNPSFTVEALPAETFEALLTVTSWIGEVVDDDPPYRLETRLDAPHACWCRLELVPDAGASTVSLTLEAVEGEPRPSIDSVRSLWIDQLNRLDW